MLCTFTERNGVYDDDEQVRNIAMVEHHGQRRTSNEKYLVTNNAAQKLGENTVPLCAHSNTKNQPTQMQYLFLIQKTSDAEQNEYNDRKYKLDNL